MKDPNRTFKDAIYEQFARIGKAVSSPKRLELLDLLCQGPRTVETLAKESGLTPANASQHLQGSARPRDWWNPKKKVCLSPTGWPIRRCASSSGTCGCWQRVSLAEVEQTKCQFLDGQRGHAAGRSQQASKTRPAGGRDRPGCATG